MLRRPKRLQGISAREMPLESTQWVSAEAIDGMSRPAPELAPRGQNGCDDLTLAGSADHDFVILAFWRNNLKDRPN
jgi:hypothetical protein